MESSQTPPQVAFDALDASDSRKESCSVGAVVGLGSTVLVVLWLWSLLTGSSIRKISAAERRVVEVLAEQSSSVVGSNSCGGAVVVALPVSRSCSSGGSSSCSCSGGERQQWRQQRQVATVVSLLSWDTGRGCGGGGGCRRVFAAATAAVAAAAPWVAVVVVAVLVGLALVVASCRSGSVLVDISLLFCCFNVWPLFGTLLLVTSRAAVWLYASRFSRCRTGLSQARPVFNFNNR